MAILKKHIFFETWRREQTRPASQLSAVVTAYRRNIARDVLGYAGITSHFALDLKTKAFGMRFVLILTAQNYDMTRRISKALGDLGLGFLAAVAHAAPVLLVPSPA